MSHPKQGEIIWLDFDPQSGYEITKRWLAIVISKSVFNAKKLVLVCPITSKDHHNPLHLALPKTMKTKGYIACNHVKTLDHESRNWEPIEKASKKLLKEVIEEVKSIID